MYTNLIKSDDKRNSTTAKWLAASVQENKNSFGNECTRNITCVLSKEKCFRYHLSHLFHIIHSLFPPWAWYFFFIVLIFFCSTGKWIERKTIHQNEFVLRLSLDRTWYFLIVINRDLFSACVSFALRLLRLHHINVWMRMFTPFVPFLMLETSTRNRFRAA